MIRRTNDWLAERDERISGRMRFGEDRRLRRIIAIAVTHSADGLPFLIFLGLLYLIGTPAWRARVIVLLLADLLTFLVVQTLKFLIRRSRPAGEWGQMYRRMDPFSFPSGHSARGGAMATIGIIVGPPWFAVLLAVWGVMVAFSRILLGVHYLSDAMGGFALGVALSLAITFILLA